MKSNEMLPWDEVSRRNYRSKAFSDYSWFRVAESLIQSAKELEQSVFGFWQSYREYTKGKTKKVLPDYYQKPYFMMIAFAIENLFKGQIVRLQTVKLQEGFEQNSKFPKQLKEHDLFKLASQAGFQFENHDEDLLRRLTRCAIWAGRYPVPLRYGDSSGIQKFSNGKEYQVSWFGGDDIKLLTALVERIVEQFDIKIKI